jgi:hypothetical protein
MKSKMANGNKFTMETFSDNENVTIEKLEEVDEYYYKSCFVCNTPPNSTYPC